MEIGPEWGRERHVTIESRLSRCRHALELKKATSPQEEFQDGDEEAEYSILPCR